MKTWMRLFEAETDTANHQAKPHLRRYKLPSTTKLRNLRSQTKDSQTESPSPSRTSQHYRESSIHYLPIANEPLERGGSLIYDAPQESAPQAQWQQYQVPKLLKIMTMVEVGKSLLFELFRPLTSGRRDLRACSRSWPLDSTRRLRGRRCAQISDPLVLRSSTRWRFAI